MLPILESMKDHIECHVKYTTRQMLDEKSPTELLGLCHPLYRGEYARLLYKNGDITLLDARTYNQKL